jgi:hypothetical protein
MMLEWRGRVRDAMLGRIESPSNKDGDNGAKWKIAKMPSYQNIINDVLVCVCDVVSTSYVPR